MAVKSERAVSAEPADPRIAVVASVLSDAHFGDSSEDVCDGFRNLARHALAAADAVTPPDDETVSLIDENGHVVKSFTREVGAAVVSPPPSDTPTEYEQVGHIVTDLRGEEPPGFTRTVGEFPERKNWEPVFRRVRDENEKTK